MSKIDLMGIKKGLIHMVGGALIYHWYQLRFVYYPIFGNICL